MGRADVSLSEVGRAQIERLAGALPTIDRVISSPLQRTRDTAAALGFPVEIDERVVEVDYGVYDLLPLGDVPADVWTQWRTDFDFVPPSGESMRAMGMRVVEFCENISDLAATQNIVVVSHVSPIKAAVAWALGVPDDSAWRLHVDQASITRISIGARGPVLHSFNETGHLDGIGS